MKEREEPPGVKRRLALSLAGQLHGCLAGYLFLAAYQFATAGYLYNFHAMVFWPVLFALLGWLLFVAPIVVRLPADHPLFRIDRYPLFGALYGLVVFLVIVGSWSGFWRSAPFLIWPAIIGFTSALFYSAVLPRVSNRSQLRLLLASPFVLPVLIALVAWPLMEKTAPYLAYRFGNPDNRSDMQSKVIKSIRVGDRLEDLHEKYPKFFIKPTGIPSKDGDYVGSTAFFQGSSEYSIVFYRGAVQKITIRENSAASAKK